MNRFKSKPRLNAAFKKAQPLPDLASIRAAVSRAAAQALIIVTRAESDLCRPEIGSRIQNASFYAVENRL